MSPERGPRRHFTHQQFSPSFVPHDYDKNKTGRMERLIDKKIKLLINKLSRKK